MSESKIVVERVFRGDMVEYRTKVYSIYCVSHDIDDKVPTMYIAAYLTNALREYIQTATMDEKVTDLIKLFRENDTYHCPMCGKALDSDS